MKQTSGEKRLMMGFSMFKTVQKLVQASLISKSVKPTPADLKRALFLRFYKNDFRPEVKKKIFHSWFGNA